MIKDSFLLTTLSTPFVYVSSFSLTRTKFVFLEFIWSKTTCRSTVKETKHHLFSLNCHNSRFTCDMCYVRVSMWHMCTVRFVVPLFQNTGCQWVSDVTLVRFGSVPTLPARPSVPARISTSEGEMFVISLRVAAFLWCDTSPVISKRQVQRESNEMRPNAVTRVCVALLLMLVVVTARIHKLDIRVGWVKNAIFFRRCLLHLLLSWTWFERKNAITRANSLGTSRNYRYPIGGVLTRVVNYPAKCITHTHTVGRSKIKNNVHFQFAAYFAVYMHSTIYMCSI